MHRISLSVAAVVSAAALALPAAASAQPRVPTFHRAFPVASRLCAAAQAGHLPARLAASADQINQDCATLQSAFSTAESDLQTALSPVVQQVRDLASQVRDACRQARQSGDRAACQQARSDARATLQQLRAQVGTAVSTFRHAANAARQAFWTSVRSLRGAGRLHADRPVGQVQEPSVPTTV